MKTIRYFKSPDATITVEKGDENYYVTRRVRGKRKTTIEDYDTEKEALFEFLRSVSLWVI